jgi:hypothetical protein
VKALKDAGAHAGQAVNQYQDMDFRRLNVDHLDWKHPEPSPFDEDAYDALYLKREDEHDAWVLSDPRMLFYIEDLLGLAKSHSNKSRIVVIHSGTAELGVLNARHTAMPESWSGWTTATYNDLGTPKQVS